VADSPDPTSQADVPLVSALVPTYNAAAFVEATLESLAKQTWPRLEILIGDDASTDGTMALLESFAAAHHNVRLLRRTENLGWLRNSNDLMEQAAGEFLFFAFHDDTVAPTYVEELATVLVERPEVLLAYSDMTVSEVGGPGEQQVFDDLTTTRTALQRGIVMAGRRKNWWVPNRGLFRASAYRAVGGLRPNDAGEYSADWTWLLALALRGPFARVPKVLCDKHYTPNSLSKTWRHDATQQAALRRAGREEVRRSPLSRPAKLVLSAHLSGWRRWVPAPLRHLVRASAQRLVRG
jgi:glycosyltransferase involved in cell wall biosynthesis